MADVEKIYLSDFEGDFDKFVDACYNFYLKTWETTPKFNKKRIFRNRTIYQEKEESFWGIVNGHDEEKSYDNLERYEKIPCFKYGIQNVNSSSNSLESEILWFIDKQKVHVLCRTLNYLFVLDENNQDVWLVTGFPISDRKCKKIINRWKDYWDLY